MTSKRIVSLFLCLSMLLAYFPTVYANSAANSCGDNLTWAFNESSGLLTISGSGDMDYFGYQQSPWYSLRGEIKSVVFDGEITGLSGYAFLDCTALEEITIPESVQELGSCTFEYCTNLTSVNILSTRLWFIDGSIFNGCDNLSGITISENCENYKSIDGIVYTKDGGTLACYPAGRKAATFETPEDVYAIRMDAFRNHHFLQEIIMHENVSDIEEGFVCSCPKLSSIVVDENNMYYTAVDDVLFTKDMKTLLCYAEAKSGTSYAVPDGVERIGDYAFYDTNVEEFDLPDSVCTIGAYAFSYGTWWRNNYSAENGTYLDNHLLDIPRNAESFTVQEGTKSIATYAGAWRNNMTEVTLPESLEYIGNSAFYGSNKLATVNFAEGLISIGDEAFSSTGLTSINLPDSVEHIGKDVFEWTPLLQNSDLWSEDALYAGKFLITAKSDLSGNYTVKDGTRVILPRAFYNCSSVESVTLPDSVEIIGDDTFSWQSKFTNIPKNIVSIGDYAYRNADGIFADGKLILPEGLTHVGSNAFTRYSGDSIKSLILPASLAEVEDYAFGEIKVENFTIKNPDTVYGKSAFSRSGAKSVAFPDGIVRIQDNLFEYCDLSSLFIPESVEYIGRIDFNWSEPVIFYPGTEDEWNQIEIVTGDNFDRVTVYHNFSPQGSCGENATWTLDVGTGTLTISGTGTTVDYKIANNSSDFNTPWKSFSNLIETVVIEDGITYIGECFFKNCKNLKTIYVPSSVAGFGGDCFTGCYNLEEVHAESLEAWLDIVFNGTWYGDSMYSGSYEYNSNPLYGGADFYIGDTLVKELVIPIGTRTINERAFEGCRSIERVSIGLNLKFINDYAFYNCTNIQAVDYEGYVYQWNEISIGEGNECLTNAPIYYNADKIKPEIALTKEPELSESIIKENVDFELSVSDNVAIDKLVVQISEAGSDTYTVIYEKTVPEDLTLLEETFTFDISKQENRSITLRFLAYDKNGNESEYIDKNYVIDTAKPVISVDEDAVNNVKNIITEKHSVRVSVTDNYWLEKLVIEASLNGEAFEKLSEEINAEKGETKLEKTIDIDPDSISTGDLEIKISAYDKGGNISDIVTKKYIIDHQLPSIKIEKVCPLYEDGIKDVIKGKTRFEVAGQDNYYVEKITMEISEDMGASYKKFAEASPESTTPSSGNASQSYTAGIDDSVSGDSDISLDYVSHFSHIFELDTEKYPDGNFYVRFIAYDMAGNKSIAFYETYKIDNTAPASVSNLTASGTPDFIYLMWAKYPVEKDFAYFNIYRSETASGGFELHNKISTIGFFDDSSKGTDPDKTYYYYVTCVDKFENEGEPSNIVSASLGEDNSSPEIVGVLPKNDKVLYKQETMKISAHDNYRVEKVIAEYSPAQEDSYTLIEEVTFAEKSKVKSYEWNFEDLEAGEYNVRYTAVDAAGNYSEPVVVKYEIGAYEAPVAPIVSAESGHRSVSLKWEYSGNTAMFAHYTIYRKLKDSDEDFKIITETDLNEFTDEPELGEYIYIVEAVDKFGGTACSSEVAASSILNDDIAPTALITLQNALATPDMNIVFDSSLSEDNDKIVSYNWNFGDGTTSAEKLEKHSYNSIGEYEVSLTVTDEAGNSAVTQVTVKVVDPSVGSKYEKVNITVQNNAEGETAEGTQLIIIDQEDDSKTILTADEEGKASLVLENGTYLLNAIKGESKVLNKQITVGDDQTAPMTAENEPLMLMSDDYTGQDIVITLNQQRFLRGTFETHEMSYDEIIAAGINTSDPANRIVIQFKLTLVYESEEWDDEEELGFTFYSNMLGDPLDVFRGGGTGGGDTGRWQCYRLYDPEDDYEDDIERNTYYLVLSGEVGFLKQMFDAHLIMVNDSEVDWVEDCRATINLENGMSLAGMLGASQNRTQFVSSKGSADGVIAPSSQGEAHWYARGDNPGEYNISVDVTGNILPEPKESFKKTFVTKEPIVVADLAKAVKIDFYNIPRVVEHGEEKIITLAVTNTSNKPLYAFSMFMKSNRGGEVSDEMDNLAPGATATLDIPIVFDFSTSNKDHITYYLKKQTLEVSNDVPVNYHFADDGDTGLTTTVELYEDQECTQTKKLSKLKYSCGSFSWDKSDANDLTEPRKTNYDVLYMKVTTKNELTQTGAVDAASNVNVVVTAPDGFSFKEYELAYEQQINMGNLDINEERSVSVPVYPIYSEKYNNGDVLEFTVKASSSVHSAKTTQEKTVVIEKNAEEGQLFFAETNQKYEKPIDASMFKESSYKYSHELAKLGLALSSMAYRNREEITQSLFNLGFSSIEVYENADVMAVNHSFAKKKIIIDNEVITLLATPIRGTVDITEWIGNAWLGINSAHHTSFNAARADVYTDLYDYQRTLGFNSNDTRIKLFLCGHSRGAAVANLLATDSFGGIDLEDIYTYTFATPNTTLDNDINDTKYRNIFNILYPTDVVTMVPPRDVLGYYRYGSDWALPFELSSKYANYISKVYNEYNKYSDAPFGLLSFNEATVWKNIKEKLLMELYMGTVTPEVLCTHSPANYMAWLETISGVSDYYTLQQVEHYKKVDINCPVDVEVYNSNNELVCRIVNDVVDETLPKRIYAEVIGESKTVYLPNDDTYSFKITGTDNGTMDYTIVEYNEEGVKSRVVNFYDVPVENGKTTTSVVNNVLNTDVGNYKLTLSDSSTREHNDEFTGDNLDKLVVTAEKEGNGFVIGDGSYTKGEYATLYALENESDFLSWYKDDALVSTDAEYKFAVTEDTTLEARFNNHEKTAMPVANPSGGVVTSSTTVALSTTTPDAEIYYTVDGSQPTKYSTRYSTPISITATTTINAITVKVGMATSDVMTETYTVRSDGSGGGGVSRYTVKFETNDGSAVKAITVNRNAAATEPTAPTKEGFKFDGWYTNKELTTAYDFTAKVTKNFTLYAKWTEIEKEPVVDEPETTITFSDVKENDWFYANVQYVVENKLMNGVAENKFAPNDTLTRAMLVTVLYRNAGEPAVNKSIPFADVTADSYYANAVIWAHRNGIVSGVNENEFAPDENITREQIATIIYRYAQYKGYDTSAKAEISAFADYNEISEYAIEAMQYAVGCGLIKGKTETTLNSKDNATRAEIAAILQRFIEGNR